MSKLKAVDTRQDFVAMENRLLDWWKQEGVIKQYLVKNQGSDKNFSFIDGPITANNPMGLHHAWGRTYKDFVSRYKNMKGFEQRFQMGFDCQGLWVEVEVEKALGFNSKKDIFEYGLGKFTDECKARVTKYSGIQTTQSERLGMFMDWENSYYTMSENNNLYIWQFLKKCFNEGLIYKSHSATTWCPRCETGLSQHEQADGYKDVVDTSVFVKFKIADRENEYILAWTTTPWTLSANVLLAVNSSLQYAKVKEGENTLYLGYKAAKRLGFKEIEEYDVNNLLNLRYESLYEIPAQEGVDHYVVDWELVAEDDGTGIVHIAPGCGQEDYELGIKIGAPAISPLNESGKYMEGYGELTGMYAHDVKDMVLEYLKCKGLLFKTQDYSHSYPHCWRCKTKCLFRLENNWFINISKIRDRLKKAADTVDWVPDYSGKRMNDWLTNMGDWMISRKRFYGLALPFYECECGELTVVGSKDELKSLAVDPSKVDALTSVHRPWIDDIAIKCPKCGKEVKRIADVGDCWLDAGVVGFSTLKYNEDREYWKKWFPADFITEMIEQVRLWFYSMLVFGVVMEDKVPYMKALSFAEMRDEKNDKMSKTKKNYIPFEEAADKVGSDLIRWNFFQSPFGKNVRFGWNVIEDQRRQFLLPFWNIYSYFVMYAQVHNWEYDSTFDTGNLTQFMDKWIVTYLKKLVVDVTNDLDEYRFYNASTNIQKFVLDLSTWYIRRTRDRFKSGDMDALNTLYFILTELTKLLAPFMPFVTEEIYQNLVVSLGLESAKLSVHLESYPEPTMLSEEETRVLERMEKVTQYCAMGLKIRDEKRIKLRQPLSRVYVDFDDEQILEILKGELNVKEAVSEKEQPKGDGLVLMEAGSMKLTLDTNISEELEIEGLYREIVRAVQNARKEAGLVVGQKVEMEFFTINEKMRMAMASKLDQFGKDVGASEVELKGEKGGDMFTIRIGESELYVSFEK